jgi:hypothetical protein
MQRLEMIDKLSPNVLGLLHSGSGRGHSNRQICESAGAIECLGTPMGKRLAVTTSIPESISQESSEVDGDDRVGGSFTVKGQWRANSVE